MSYDLSFPSNVNVDSTVRSYNQELFEGTPYLFKLLEVGEGTRRIQNMDTKSFRFAVFTTDTNIEVSRIYVSLRLPENFDTVPSDKHWMIAQDVEVLQSLAKARCKQNHFEESLVIDDLNDLVGYMFKGEVKPRSYTNKTGGTSWAYTIIGTKPYNPNDVYIDNEAINSALESDIPF